MHALFSICGTSRKSDCGWRGVAETVFETANINAPFLSGSNFGLPCFEINPIRIDKVADALCGSDLKMLTLGNRKGATTGCFFIRIPHLDAVVKLAGLFLHPLFYSF